jgi:hypothetical protein
MKIRLIEVAKVIRSKNAGPYELTLDILLKERRVYEMMRDQKIISGANIALLYGLPPHDVLNVIYFDPAQAIKITLKRRISSGAPGETDVYGAQQHAPLLDFAFEWDGDPLTGTHSQISQEE